MNYWEKRFLKDKAQAVNAAEKYCPDAGKVL